MEISVYKIRNEKNYNLILGQTHFIKSVPDLYEALSESSPNIKFGLAFCEASGPCLLRFAGNDEELIDLAKDNLYKINAGHSFIIFLKDAFPINVLNNIKYLSEVCRIFCATSNPVEVIIAETEQGRGILGVIDGFKTKGIETDKDIEERRELLKKIGYKEP
ncbi:MAG: adenosine-specific kinase [Caldisericia bacterium]|jgi:hypothetical protein|nr:adenosine-specific kinase [Caldisericia bacterium]HPO28978.1 adenosine-specific kinase [Caldisericia bacterium]